MSENKPSAPGQSEGQIALLNRLRRSPIPLVYGRSGWRPEGSLPRPATRADFDAVLRLGLARIDGDVLKLAEHA
jgi:hypothetical protein